MFYDNFEFLCRERGISISKACEEMNFSNATASRWKQGSIPQNKALKTISGYFNVPVDELLYGIKKTASYDGGGGVNDAETAEFSKLYDLLSESQKNVIRQTIIEFLSAK